MLNGGQSSIYRKVADNQIKSLRFVLLSSPENILQFESEGRSDEWCDSTMYKTKKDKVRLSADDVFSQEVGEVLNDLCQADEFVRIGARSVWLGSKVLL